jgi:hypothetical protein
MEEMRMSEPGSRTLTALEVLESVQLEDLESMVELLKEEKPVSEVRAAIVELIARAPISQFGVFRRVLQLCPEDCWRPAI